MRLRVRRMAPWALYALFACVLATVGWSMFSGRQVKGDLLEATQAQRAKTAAHSPVIVLPGTEFDMGLLPNDEESVRSFPIRNTGAAPLRISGISTMCGCTKGEIAEEDKVIPPGGEAQVRVTFFPTKMSGFESRKQLTIRSNDPNRSGASVTVVARVKPEFNVEPDTLQFGSVDKGATPEAFMHFRPGADEDVLLKNVEPGRRPEHYELTWDELPESEWRAPGRPEYRIRVRLLPSIPVGTFYDAIYLDTTCKRLPRYRCAIHADVASFYTVEPRMLAARRRVAPGQKQIARAVIKADRPFEVINLAVSDERLVVAAQQGGDDRTMLIDVDVAPDAGDGLVRATVTFTVASDDRAIDHSIRAYASVKRQGDS